MTKPKLLYLVTEDWYFWSHRLPIAREAQKRGYEVLVAARVDRHGEKIRAEGFKLIPLTLKRRNTNPLYELNVLLEIINIYRREKPSIVHHVAMKPVLYGSIAARIVGVPYVVNALAGLGYVFTSDRGEARFLKKLISSAFKLLLSRKGSLLILQNRDDRAMFLQLRLIDEPLIRIIRGSGVDTELFQSVPLQPGIPVIALISRMLWDKGVGEFVKAARLLKIRGVDARFVLVGGCDTDNPNSVPYQTLQEWHEEGIVEAWGKVDDMAEIYSRFSIVCLPSYREGVPKVLLEAAACGLPIVTTDAPGCREVVRSEYNGLLVPVKSITELADALQILAKNPDLRQRMGMRGREIVLSEFAVEKVVVETLAVYEELFK